MPLPKHFRKNNGFTLVELMIAMAISLFLIGGVVMVQSSSRFATLEAERLSRLQEGIRFSSDFLIRDIRNAGFRDQLSLSLEQFNDIGTPFAQITNVDTDGDGAPDSESLEIRYAGWGSCATGFDAVGEDVPPNVVSNRYFVEDNELKCQGINGLAAGESPKTVRLASGFESIDFTLMCASDASGTLNFNETCTSCEIWINDTINDVNFAEEIDTLEKACYGVRMGLEFAPPEGAAGASSVRVERSTSFRNILLGQMMWQAARLLD